MHTTPHHTGSIHSPPLTIQATSTHHPSQYSRQHSLTTPHNATCSIHSPTLTMQQAAYTHRPCQLEIHKVVIVFADDAFRRLHKCMCTPPAPYTTSGITTLGNSGKYKTLLCDVFLSVASSTDLRRAPSALSIFASFSWTSQPSMSG